VKNMTLLISLPKLANYHVYIHVVRCFWAWDMEGAEWYIYHSAPSTSLLRLFEWDIARQKYDMLRSIYTSQHDAYYEQNSTTNREA
jgi:hypothetical protein